MIVMALVVLVCVAPLLFFLWIDRDTPGNVNGPGK